LLGGIRRVAEAVEYLKLQDGDRIGHGVALGVDVDEWAGKTSGIMVPRGERLLDLLWVWRAAMQSGSPTLHAWLPWVGQEASRLAHAIFHEERLSLTILSDWVTRLHSTDGLLRAGFPAGRAIPAPDLTMTLLRSWLCDTGVFTRAQKLEPVLVPREVSLVTELQSLVRANVARRGIVVEINPTSNLLIGHLAELTRHPLWRICPPRGGTPGSAIRICIGSDDPITFATRLPEEYQLLSDAMVDGGLSSHEADEWLDRARATGLASRFTVQRSSLSLTSHLGLSRLAIVP
jgi:hypothetical protein